MIFKLVFNFILLVPIFVYGAKPLPENALINNKEKPNIILIMSDDHGWFDTGFNGNSEIKTPCMDSLASQGIVFDRFYAASAVCSPTRASVLTGRNPLRMNISTANEGHLPKEEITIAELLKKEMYVTAHFGKWHLGSLSKTVRDSNRGGKPEFINDYSIPSEHGYDRFFSTESKVPTYDPMKFPTTFEDGESLDYGWKAIENNEEARNYGTAYWKGENQIENVNLKGDDSRIIIDRVIPFIEESKLEGKPFFTTIWFHTPHLPIVTSQKYMDMYQNLTLQKQLYYGAITAMDEQIGRLWNKLVELNIDENTIVFYCSDNGPETNTPGSAGDFRGKKKSLFEGGIRVPAFVIWKSHLQENIRIDFPVVTSDYLPTILDLLDIEYPEDRPLDGISILEAMDGGLIERTVPIGFLYGSIRSWITNNYKLISKNSGQSYELYDLVNDRSERKNLINVLPDTVYEMQLSLSTWMTSVQNSKTGNDYPFSEDVQNTLIYPNPAHNVLFLDLNVEKIRIYTLSGRTEAILRVPESRIVDISQLTSGIKLVELISNTGGSSTVKILVK